MICSNEQNIPLRINIFEHKRICRPLVFIHAWTNASIFILVHELKWDVTIVALFLIIVDDYEVLILWYWYQVLAPRGQRCYTAFVLFSCASNDLLALHVKLFDSSGYGSKCNNVWILLHNAHRCQLYQILVNYPGGLRFEAEEFEVVAASIHDLQFFESATIVLLGFFEVWAEDLEAFDWVVFGDLPQIVVGLGLARYIDAHLTVTARGHEETTPKVKHRNDMPVFIRQLNFLVFIHLIINKFVDLLVKANVANTYGKNVFAWLAWWSSLTSSLLHIVVLLEECNLFFVYMQVHIEQILFNLHATFIYVLNVLQFTFLNYAGLRYIRLVGNWRHFCQKVFVVPLQLLSLTFFLLHGFFKLYALHLHFWTRHAILALTLLEAIKSITALIQDMLRFFARAIPKAFLGHHNTPLWLNYAAWVTCFTNLLGLRCACCQEPKLIPFMVLRAWSLRRVRLYLRVTLSNIFNAISAPERNL